VFFVENEFQGQVIIEHIGEKVNDQIRNAFVEIHYISKEKQARDYIKIAADTHKNIFKELCQ
jgi:hypothetical protein